MPSDNFTSHEIYSWHIYIMLEWCLSVTFNRVLVDRVVVIVSFIIKLLPVKFISLSIRRKHYSMHTNHLHKAKIVLYIHTRLKVGTTGCKISDNHCLHVYNYILVTPIQFQYLHGLVHCSFSFNIQFDNNHYLWFLLWLILHQEGLTIPFLPGWLCYTSVRVWERIPTAVEIFGDHWWSFIIWNFYC